MLGADLKKGSAEFLVLSLLEHERRHGYELNKLIESRSKGALVFHIASLYPLLYRMEDRGWIAGRWVEKAGERRRRFYSITAAVNANRIRQDAEKVKDGLTRKFMEGGHQGPAPIGYRNDKLLLPGREVRVVTVDSDRADRMSCGSTYGGEPARSSRTEARRDGLHALLEVDADALPAMQPALRIL